MEFVLRPDPYIDAYRQNLQELSSLLRVFGFHLEPFKDSSLPLFHNLHPDTRQNVAQSLHAYVGALRAELASGEYNNERFILQFLFRLGQAPNPELQGILKNERFIQIYNRDNLQIFRSLACYERCSFTLEQLTSRTWFELWERDNLFYMAFTGMAHKMLDVVRFTCFNFDFPFHKVTEIDSASKYSFQYKLKTVCGLTRQNQIRSALLVEEWQF